MAGWTPEKPEFVLTSRRNIIRISYYWYLLKVLHWKLSRQRIPDPDPQTPIIITSHYDKNIRDSKEVAQQ
jgi:hypothetical protein